MELKSVMIRWYYAAERWATRSKNENRVRAAEMKFLRQKATDAEMRQSENNLNKKALEME